MHRLNNGSSVEEEAILEIRPEEESNSELMACQEVQRVRRVDGNGSPLPCLDVFKISKGEWSNQPFLLFGCFKNQDGDERKWFKQTNLPLFENGLATLVYD